MYIAGWLRALILLGTQQFRMAQARYDPMICGTAKQPARTDPYALQGEKFSLNDFSQPHNDYSLSLLFSSAPWECWDYINRGKKCPTVKPNGDFLITIVIGYISWDVFYPSCGLNHQSPIDIYPQMVVPRPELPELQFRNFNQFVTEFRMTNLRAGTCENY